MVSAAGRTAALQVGSARRIDLPDASVQCVVTSPPYWGLRQYAGEQREAWGGDPEHAHEWRAERIRTVHPQQDSLGGIGNKGTRGHDSWTAGAAGAISQGAFCACGAWYGALGLEPTPELYVEHVVEVFREVRRVLRKDGTLWLNLGDSYAGSWGNQGRKPERGTQRPINGGMITPVLDGRYPSRGSNTGAVPPGLKPKDLVGIPWAVSKALQAPYYTGRIKAERDRVWLAAMIDAEGTICGFDHDRSDGGGHRSGVHMTITNTSAALLDEAARIWPASRSEHQRSGAGHLGSRQSWRWIVHGVANKMAALSELYPYLIVKRQQAVVAYTLLSLMADAKRLSRTPQASEIIAKRAVLTGLLSDLNQGRGVVLPNWLIEPPSMYEPGWYLRSDIIWHKCLSASTRLYARTPRSEGPATLHDLVRLDPATVELWNGEHWTRVVSWSCQRAETVRLRLRSGERITASRNHRWPLADGRMVATSDLRVGDVLATAELPEPEDPTDVGLSTDLAWFAGLYLAEGSRSDDAIQIAGHADEVERHERVRRVAERYGGSAVTHHGPSRGVSVVVHGAFLDAALRHFLAGRTALDKHLHPRAWRSSNAALRALVEGYLAGDGSYDAANDRWRIGFGNNPQLAENLRTLAARLGATLTLSPSLARVGRARVFEAYRGEWRWKASGHGNAKERAEVLAVEALGESEVWDVAVADDPHLFALASGVLTHNSNPMPESVTDRPTKSHEYLFLLTKSERYYYDADAIREPRVEASAGRYAYALSGAPKGAEIVPGDVKGRRTRPEGMREPTAGRNKRTVWTIATRPYKGAHFATFPPDLVEPGVLAGSSPQACGVCGAPWERVTERTPNPAGLSGGLHREVGRPEGLINNRPRDYEAERAIGSSQTVGWRSTCEHEDGSGACVVLDPFVGSGTTGQVALRHGRDFAGVDASDEYLTLAVARVSDHEPRVRKARRPRGAGGRT